MGRDSWQEASLGGASGGSGGQGEMSDLVPGLMGNPCENWLGECLAWVCIFKSVSCACWEWTRIEAGQCGDGAADIQTESGLCVECMTDIQNRSWPVWGGGSRHLGRCDPLDSHDINVDGQVKLYSEYVSFGHHYSSLLFSAQSWSLLRHLL